MDRSLIVTTVPKPSDSEILHAENLAKELQADYVKRTSTVRKMQETHGVRKVLVAGERLTLHAGDQKLFFHPSMAVVRVKRMLLGDTDVIVEKSGLARGDSVLDCTLGMGADAIVFSHAVGKEGVVIGIEYNPILVILVREGLKTWRSGVPEVDEAMRRVQVVTGSHLGYMRNLPDRSIDVVYFDPMFRETVKESINFDPIRILSVTDELSVEAIGEAKRIARKSVVLKERMYSGEFQRLGFPQPYQRSSSFTYSVISIQGEESP
ncbi:class I SAM-dependent methyltransferase [Effusibacillus consociatus]|uniref:Class I SAM-dependent methyltransferase n=1 Tax=Effusibacillus consociatus TaxID=1117041 RepID=A0ABV9PWC9_9BACL